MCWRCRLGELGLEKGWGDTAGRILEMIHLLLDLLQAPDPDTLEKFLSRIPMVFTVVILSPHGYFGQAGVLGMPDTGGQVNELSLSVVLNLNSRFSFFLQIKELPNFILFSDQCLVSP